MELIFASIIITSTGPTKQQGSEEGVAAYGSAYQQQPNPANGPPSDQSAAAYQQYDPATLAQYQQAWQQYYAAMSQAGAGNGPGNGNPPSGPVSQQPQSGPDSTQYSGYFAQSGGGPPGGNGPQPNNGGPPSSGYASSGPMPNSYGAPQSGGRGGMHEGQGVPPPLMSKGSGYDPYDSGDSRGGGGHGMGGGYGGGGPGAGGGGDRYGGRDERGGGGRERDRDMGGGYSDRGRGGDRERDRSRGNWYIFGVVYIKMDDGV
ncbi:unnamed protein product [Anisakis simplex]|uniref:RNA-binding protein FUS n=1 Tax=Anisakis simplex TaxID=6269 RepID=A0A0M3K4G9_ANISI|nr:unnamed protein product [Anisakis simplex]